MNLAEFNETVRQHRHRIYGIAIHYMKDADDAADVTQDVFVTLWKHRHELDDDRVLGWLLRVTRNACIDAWRKRRTREGVFDSDTERVEQASADSLSPEHQTRATIFRERLSEALDKLDEPYRSIVVFRELHEYKYNEIAEALDLPLGTVKVYLHRARKALRQELGDHVRYDYA
ncbi:MAG: sigma-70 family RNA polymerase sigma factor [Rhodothermales bacterium]|nr:sigma-70 family RNA polymerase sigma factor [Rhodothermales bacterium]